MENEENYKCFWIYHGPGPEEWGGPRAEELELTEEGRIKSFPDILDYVLVFKQRKDSIILFSNLLRVNSDAEMLASYIELTNKKDSNRIRETIEKYNKNGRKKSAHKQIEEIVKNHQIEIIGHKAYCHANDFWLLGDFDLEKELEIEEIYEKVEPKREE